MDSSSSNAIVRTWWRPKPCSTWKHSVQFGQFGSNLGSHSLKTSGATVSGRCGLLPRWFCEEREGTTETVKDFLRTSLTWPLGHTNFPVALHKLAGTSTHFLPSHYFPVTGTTTKVLLETNPLPSPIFHSRFPSTDFHVPKIPR